MDTEERKQCVLTMAEQVRGQGVPGTLVADYEQGRLRVSRRCQDANDEHVAIVFNTDITYDRQRDTYDVTVYLLNMTLGVEDYGQVIAQSDYTDIYWDQFPEIVGKIRPGDLPAKYGGRA